MNVSLRPELAKFLDDQVKSGRFASASEAVEAGVARLMLDPEPDVADAQDLTDLRDSLDQMRRGQTIDATDLHARLRARHLR